MAQTDDAVAALEEAITGETTEVAESSTAETGSKASDDSGDKKSPGDVPYSRFKEINDEKNSLKEQLAELQSELGERSKSLDKFAEVLSAKEEDSKLLERIKSFADDPKIGPHVHALDRALKGIEEEVEDGEISPDQGLAKIRNELAQAKEELTDVVANSQADRALNDADAYAARLLENLPEEYSDKDIDVIASLLPGKVDYEALADPDNDIGSVVSKAFEEVIELYGQPRGALLNPEEVEFVDENQTEATSPEEELRALVEGTNWGASKLDGKKFVPEQSDADFSAALAKAYRVARGK